jgi:hypothetical protein
MYFGYTEFNRMQNMATDVFRVLKVNTLPRSPTSCLILAVYFGVFLRKNFERKNSF